MTRPYLTIGMPTHTDALGVWPTVQALRLYHAADLADAEILIVDQAPKSPHGEAVETFAARAGVRYIAAPDPVGTGPGKDRVFKEARGEVVLCIDSHVMLHPGALPRLVTYFRERPESKDLLVGPMVSDSLRNVSTHYDDVWSGEQWGKWTGEARRCRCGAAVVVKVGPDGQVQYSDPAEPAKAYEGCHKCGAKVTPPDDGARVPFVRQIERSGFTSTLADNGEPFPIWAQGTGLLACRKAAWPGLVDGLRGFGGFEVLLYERARRAGGRTLCAPWLKWTHRFVRPDGPKYPLRRWDKVRNYVLGFRDLGWDLAPIHAHFVATGKLSETDWHRVLAGESEVVKAPPKTAPAATPAAKPKQEKPAQPPAPGYGPGTELKAIIATLGINPSPSCDCNGKALQMDRWGVQKCKDNRETIIGWLRDGQTKWGWREKLTAAAKAVTSGLAFKLNPLDPFPSLIDEAIRRAEATEAHREVSAENGTGSSNKR